MGQADDLTAAIRGGFRAAANPVRAEGQQRYMKSAMPFHGLASPEVRQVVRAAVTAHPLADRTDWLSAVATLWDEAGHREERYAALGVLRHRRYRAWAMSADESLLALIRHLVVTGAWWDLVDETAHVVGDLLAADPTTMKPLLRRWALDPDLWLRRTAILSQLWAKVDTDRDLLTHAIEGSIADSDFFACKAIGWALREYSKTDPEWVRGFVDARADRLSGLSRREALKWLDRRPS